MSRLLDTLGRGAAKHKWLVLGAWVLLAILVFGAAKAADGKTVDKFTIPGAQSQHALDLLEKDFPARSGAQGTVVYRTRTGTVNDPANTTAINASVANMQKIPHVSSAGNGPAGAFTPSTRDLGIAFTTLQYDVQATGVPKNELSVLEHANAPARQAGLDVEYGGAVIDYVNQPPVGNSDKIGLLVSIFILLIAFGSVIAMGLPIGTAIFGLGVGLAGISLLAAFTDVGTVAPTLGAMIGLGVGIDYSLFIVTRHRENVANGMDIIDSAGNAIATAGQAVLFAGSIVVVALCGLLLAGIPYAATLGFSAALVVAIMILAAITLLPALIGIAGRNIDRLRVPGMHPSTGTEGNEVAGQAGKARGFARWAHFVGRHPWPFAVACTVVMITITIPLASMRLGQTDDGTAPASSTQRKAFDLLARGFGPGINGPLLIAVSLPDPASAVVVDRLADVLPKTKGVAVPGVLPANRNTAGDVAIIAVLPNSSPDAVTTAELVSRLRNDVIPPAVAGTNAHVFVGGQTAAFIDLGNRISERLPYLIASVVALSFLVLMTAFRSLIVPLTAAVMNLLSVGAAYGVVVAVFQWGWGKDLIGLESTIPIVSVVPMMMFAILFGLSMDYQVFLLTRIREDYALTGDPHTSVVTGLANTARVITSAALIMISVFLSFVGNPEPTVKMFGIGLASAVFIDATIVRMIFVPAVMEILGKWNWWFPHWMDRVLPRIELEGSSKPVVPATAGR